MTKLKDHNRCFDLLGFGHGSREFYTVFLQFIKRRKVLIVVIIFVALFGFGYDIWNFSLSPDEEREIVRAAGTSINIRNLLLQESRYGSWLIKQVLTLEGIFTPCVDTFMAVIFLGFGSGKPIPFWKSDRQLQQTWVLSV